MLAINYKYKNITQPPNPNNVLVYFFKALITSYVFTSFLLSDSVNLITSAITYVKNVTRTFFVSSYISFYNFFTPPLLASLLTAPFHQSNLPF